MRVTQGHVYQNAQSATARAREAAEAAQRAATTGSRIRHPGDDPSGSGQMVAFGLNSARYTAIARGTGSAYDELKLSDAALGDVSDVLTRARQMAVQFSNSTYDASQAAGAAEEVQGLIGQVVASMNTRVGNRYVFGGTADSAPPFDAAGNYSGDAGVRRVEIAPGVLQQTNVQADLHIKGTSGGVDVFAVLSDLHAALTTYTTGGVQATLDDLDQALGQVSRATAQTGSYMNALETATTAAKASASLAEEGRAAVGEVDLIEASIKLQSTQTALQATLQAAAQSFKLSLLDYL